MPSANRCPECGEPIHPFAATCPSCGADLDAHRRGRASSRLWRPQIALPRKNKDMTDLVVVALVLLLLALFAPLFGVLLALFIVWHAHRTGLVARRNIAISCAAIAIVNLAAPQLLLPHLI
jgi:zinc-ribbon domain